MARTGLRAALAAAASLTLLAAGRPEPNVAAGFQTLDFTDSHGEKFDVAFWYPVHAPTSPVLLGVFQQQIASGAPVAGWNLPLIVMSHGGLGNLGSNADTAVALAQAGFVVASISHHELGYGGVVETAARLQQFRSLIAYALHDWPGRAHLDPEQLGAFGFSVGGFTVLTEAGGIPDPARIAPHCLAAPAEWSCALAAIHHLDLAMTPPAAGIWRADSPIKAAVIAAPALGYLFDGGGLGQVRIPVQLWQASEDKVLTEPWAAQAVKRDLPRSPEFHLVAGADHSDFAAPCTPYYDKPLCRDASNFNRARFHQRFNSEVVRFFRTWLMHRPG